MRRLVLALAVLLAGYVCWLCLFVGLAHAHEYECFPNGSVRYECQCRHGGETSVGYCAELPGAAHLVSYADRQALDDCTARQWCEGAACRRPSLSECLARLAPKPRVRASPARSRVCGRRPAGCEPDAVLPSPGAGRICGAWLACWMNVSAQKMAAKKLRGGGV